MKFKVKEENGITLIALVITIIVLLILAGVTIATLTGDNGLLKKTGVAKEQNEEATNEEKIKLAVSAAQVVGQGTITTENLNNELIANFKDKETANKILDKWYYKGYKINEKGNVEKGKLLPDEYKQIEYIETTGTQYIDTRHIPTTKIRIEMEICFNGRFKSNDKSSIICSRDENKTVSFNFGHTDSNGIYVWMDKLYSKGGAIHKVVVSNEILKSKNLIIMQSKKFSYGSISTSIAEKTTDSVNNLIIAGGIDDDNNIIPFGCYNMDIYSFKIYENNILERYFIPCYCTENVTDVNEKEYPSGTIGLYDLVEGKFYTNQGTGEFLKGADV